MKSNGFDGYIRKGWLLREIGYPLSNLHGDMNHKGWLYCDCPLAVILRKLEVVLFTKQRRRRTRRVA